MPPAPPADKPPVHATRSISPFRPKSLRTRVLRLCIPMLAVLALGTFGFMWTDDWPFERALYFTIITITTVGYGDENLSIAGHRFVIAVIIFGIGIFTYAVGQVVQLVVEHQLDWERVMERKAKALTDHFIIVGFGRIGKAVCESLHQESIPFVLIDRNSTLIEQAAHAGYIAILDDATRDEVLESCSINRARGIACLTASDANNIVITLSARALCPHLFIISRAEDQDAARKLKHAGATRIISPMHSGAIAVTNAILRPHAVDFLNQNAESTQGLEFSRLTVHPGSPLDGIAIAASPLCSDSPLVIVALQHADGTTEINPSHSTPLTAGDTLIIAGHPGAVVEFCADAA